MTDVGIRELKAKLSEYLDRAAEGETIRVTDRGKLKALLVPVPGRDRMAIGEREGWITPGVAVDTAPKPVPGFQTQAGISSMDVLREDRGE